MAAAAATESNADTPAPRPEDVAAALAYKRSISKLSDGELQHVKAQIHEQSTRIRKLKEDGAPREVILQAVVKHLELKWLDVDNDEVLPPKDIKIRCKRPFKNCTSISVRQAIDAIEEETAKPKNYPNLGRVSKIFVQEVIDGSKRWRELNPETDRLTLPLIFPGPVLKDLEIFELKVEFNGGPVGIRQHERTYFDSLRREEENS